MSSVFAIEEFSTFDGPGIRTTVFFKGCPLSCSWCHNPEGQNPKPEYVRSPNGCVNCGECIRAGVTDEKGKIMLTEKSVIACPRNLVRLCGIDYSVDELEERLMKNAFILEKNGGGITFSGGEPLYDAKFLLQIMERLKGKIHIAVQTCGFSSAAIFDEVLGLTDYMLFDLKLMDKDNAKRYLGVDIAPILKNYRKLAESGKQFVTRVPLIPGVTDTETNLTEIARFLLSNGVRYVETLPYNKMAGAKYPMVMREFKPDFNPEQTVADSSAVFALYGIENRIL